MSLLRQREKGINDESGEWSQGCQASIYQMKEAMFPWRKAIDQVEATMNYRYTKILDPSVWVLSS